MSVFQLPTRSKQSGETLATATMSRSATEVESWVYSWRGLAIRIFLTSWLVFVLHFATNIVREIYPALALGDNFSFRVDEYANMHPDLFELEGYGWHIGNNPGASMVAAIPYAVFRPAIDLIVERVNLSRAASGATEPPEYNSPWPKNRDFYAEAWRRGLDVKFGLAAAVMQALAMAPSSAIGVVAVFYALRAVTGSDKKATWLALLYAFGTPVLFRTAFLNHNLMLGHFAFLGFVALWNPGNSGRFSVRQRYFFAGMTGGAAVLFDYSGVIFLAALGAYGLYLCWQEKGNLKDIFQTGFWYGVGALGPIALLWFYQWRAFGHPFYPGQHWMPPVEWIELGYQGYGAPQLELLLLLAFDYRFGLFVTAPILLLAFGAILVNRDGQINLPRREMVFILLTFIILWVFFSGSNYTRLQFNTGMRYLAPILPFLFLPVAVTLLRLPRSLAYFIGAFSVFISVALAMYRDVESGLGMLNPILRTILGGLQLPALNTLSQMGEGYGVFSPGAVSPLPLYLLVGAVLYGLWSTRFWSTIDEPAATDTITNS